MKAVYRVGWEALRSIPLALLKKTYSINVAIIYKSIVIITADRPTHFLDGVLLEHLRCADYLPFSSAS